MLAFYSSALLWGRVFFVRCARMAKQGPKADCHTVLPEELLGMDYDAMAKRFAMTNRQSFEVAAPHSERSEESCFWFFFRHRERSVAICLVSNRITRCARMAKQGPKADCHTVLPEELLGMDYDAMAKRFAMTNRQSFEVAAPHSERSEESCFWFFFRHRERSVAICLSAFSL